MKKYVCDSCRKIMDDPFSVKMKEFYYTAEYCCGVVVPVGHKNKTKIHLCETCFLGLSSLIEEKGEK